MQKILNKYSNHKDIYGFFEGVDVRHPLTVINSKFSQPFLNFPNRFSMTKIHKTGYKNLSTLNCLEWNVEPILLLCDDLHSPKM